jgi:flagellar assembly factor FliW
VSGDTVRVVSARLGTYDVPRDRLIELPDGLVGFADARRFALLEPTHPDTPFRYLLCVDRPELAFLVCDPEPFFPGYTATLPVPAGTAAEDVAALVLVTVPEDAGAMTANLLAPLVLDGRTRTGRQTILDGGRWQTRHRLLPD